MVADNASPSEGEESTSQSAVHPAEFPQITEAPASTGRVPLRRFHDVSVEISVELGRVTLPIGELLRLGAGAVLELERALSEPVDIVAQGVRLARGDVVVVEDRYAVRITEIEDADPIADATQGSGANQ